jgi:hypothetical protein
MMTGCSNTVNDALVKRRCDFIFKGRENAGYQCPSSSTTPCDAWSWKQQTGSHMHRTKTKLENACLQIPKLGDDAVVLFGHLLPRKFPVLPGLARGSGWVCSDQLNYLFVCDVRNAHAVENEMKQPDLNETRKIMEKNELSKRMKNCGV